MTSKDSLSFLNFFSEFWFVTPPSAKHCPPLAQTSSYITGHRYGKRVFLFCHNVGLSRCVTIL